MQRQTCAQREHHVKIGVMLPQAKEQLPEAEIVKDGSFSRGSGRGRLLTSRTAREYIPIVWTPQVGDDLLWQR